MEMIQKMNYVATQFQISGDVLSIEKYGNGHINRTFLLTTTEDLYILQGINTYVFPNVNELMSNIVATTEFLKERNVETLEIVRTNKDNLSYFNYGQHAYRIYRFCKGTITIEKAKTLEDVETAASAFGDFHNLLAEFDASKLYEIIPNFHNTPKRYQNLLDAMDKTTKALYDSAKREIDIATSFADKICKIADGIEDGNVKLHVTHNDPKINNVLFDEKTRSIRCVIDLDTIMPGSFLYDVGDALRSLFTGAMEDSEDYLSVTHNKDIFRSYVAGYLKKCKASLTKREIQLIAYSAFLMTYEVGIRFLEDYLRGNLYFHVAYPTHNLVRCRTQFNLAQDIYAHLDELDSLVDDIVKGLE